MNNANLLGFKLVSAYNTPAKLASATPVLVAKIGLKSPSKTPVASGKTAR